jgi:protein-L-isoaspartate(D-aspartate) O-methyltransferase
MAMRQHDIMVVRQRSFMEEGAVAMFPCEGARDAESERALAAAFERGGGERVTRLYRRDDLPDEQCWLRAPGWYLAYR